MPVTIHESDVLDWAASYGGEPFHAMLCDPPYELGFMGKSWDASGVAHRPETWAALSAHLLPGAFVFAFAGSRGWHRQAAAMEDAGLIMHPTLFRLWAFGSGFPKATRIPDERFDGHRYGGQAIKPAVEPVLCFQKPYSGKPRECIVATGAGALNVDAGRIGTGGQLQWETPRGLGYHGAISAQASAQASALGRWPANLTLEHTPDCLCVGAKRVKNAAGPKRGEYGSNEPNARGGVALGRGLNTRVPNREPYGDADGREPVEAWECAPGCPVAMLDRQSGQSTSSAAERNNAARPQTRAKGAEQARVTTGISDHGTASHFFHRSDWRAEVAERLANADPLLYQAKSGVAEREAGLDVDGATRANMHPTVKPIALTRWLAALLLPPSDYAPRKILVPFAGVGSECIGASLAGWDEVVGIERDPDYVALARQRVAHHCAQPSLFDDAGIGA